MDVAEKFHGIKCDVTKASYEVKERGDNPETGELKMKMTGNFGEYDSTYTQAIYDSEEDAIEKDGTDAYVKRNYKFFGLEYNV